MITSTLSRPRRSTLFAAGCAVLVLAWMGPLPLFAETRFLAHMAMHVSVVAIAAPLLAFGLAGGRHDPAARWPALFAPVPLSLVELLVIWGWHAPALHDLARGHGAWLMLEQGMFLFAALLVWLSAVGGGAERRRERAAAGVGGLLLTSMHMTLLGTLLAVSNRQLYEACLGLGDQQAGGVLMLAVGGAAYLAGGLVLLAGLLRDGERA